VPRSAYQRAPEASFLYNLSVTARSAKWGKVTSPAL
jgi:hypothetical protein